MNINDLLKEKKITKYRLSKNSGVAFATVNDICSGRAKIAKCAADTVYKLSKALEVSMEVLIADAMEYRIGFETFKSNVCHKVKDLGDIDFIIETLESDEIRSQFNKKWYPEAFYLLAMVDYLSRENGLPLASEYQDIRSARLREPIYPAGVLTLGAVSGSDTPKTECLYAAIPEFLRFNIIESEVRNVY
ncbi:MAG: helix-turn-helix transcriptional regulator [Firmicutes bacterium]|nr:helix-turn-helix transcriptional regulator [Bacillota bacterium]